MPEYRLYLIGSGGHLQPPIEFNCENDEEALRESEARRGPLAAELWSLSRLVGRLGDAPA